MASWLDLIPEASGCTLIDTGRLERLVDDMPFDSQPPSFVYFAGDTSRIKALQALFPYNNITRRCQSGFVRLHLITESSLIRQPVLCAEGGISGASIPRYNSVSYWPTEKLRRYPLDRPQSWSMADIKSHVVSHFILPWVQVMCFFVDSMSQISKVREILQQPVRNLTIGSRPIPSYRQVILVLTESPGNAVAKAIGQLVHYLEGEIELNVSVLDLRDRFALSPTARFEPLRRMLSEKLLLARNQQVDNGSAFSADHLYALWERTLELEIGKQESSMIDCFAIARENHRMNSISKTHIKSFLEDTSISRSNEDGALAFIASALAMNAYPPGMHAFTPSDVYRELYHKELKQAFEEHAMSGYILDSSDVFHFFDIFSGQIQTASTSCMVRRTSMNEFFGRYGGLYSTLTCFSCLCRPPEHTLPCGHTLCDTCAVIFGGPSRQGEYYFDIDRCPLCGSDSHQIIRQLPPTKGPVIISLDGGGIRGIIQLGLLLSLHQRLGGEISLGDVADLCGGTSVGGLNLMDQIFNNSSAEHSFNRFTELAKRIFRWPAPANKSLSSRCMSWISCLKGILSDGQYDVENLEDVLKEELGTTRRIFDSETTCGPGPRVAVITSRISDGKACVLANYRGVGNRLGGASYEFLTPKTRDENPFLWQVARCCVAAPWYFKTKSLPGFGSLQDGGVRANNPLAITLKESSVVWPNAGKQDLLLSVGTGSLLKLFNSETQCTRALRDSAIPRLVRAVMASPSMDAEQGFFETLNFLPTQAQADIHRLDHVFSGRLPRLDEVDKIEKLAQENFSVPDELVRALLAKGFLFFELDHIPAFKQGSLLCHGSILCKGTQPRAVVKQLKDAFPDAFFQTQNGQPLGRLDEDDGCMECGYYRKKVKFILTSREESFTIVIRGSLEDQKIGGFPASVKELLTNQQALNRFGRTDHSSATWPPQRVCFCHRGKRRKVRFAEFSGIVKKERLLGSKSRC